MKYVTWFVVVVCVFSGSALAFSRGGWSGSSPWSNGQDATRTVRLGKYTLTVPEVGTVVQLGEDRITLRIRFRQIISTHEIDVLSDMGIVMPQLGSTSQWTFAFGSNGNVLVYQARHKTLGVYVHGLAETERQIHDDLNQIKVEAPAVQPATKPTK